MDVLTLFIPGRSAKRGVDLILRNDVQHRVSKHGTAREIIGDPGSVLRDAALRATLRTRSNDHTNRQSP